MLLCVRSLDDYVVVRVVQTAQPSDLVRVVEFSGIVWRAERQQQRIGVVVAICCVVEPLFVIVLDRLPEVDETVNVAVVQPEDRVKGSHGYGAHVASATGFCSVPAADPVLNRPDFRQRVV